MYIKKVEPQIDPEEPFKEDKLSRRESAEILTQLLKTVEGPLVLSIDSPWGTGKTTFVKMWKQHLSNNESGFRCLYFNAWENDFSDDPLISFIGEMQSEIVASLNEESSRSKEYFEKAKSVSGSLAKKAIPGLLKALTYGILDLDDINEKILADLAYEIAQEEIENYEAKKKTLKEFKDNLAGFVAELSKSEDENKRPLVFFIDELDRCRPTYAIELLERVKHLFSVPGIVFVIVIDKNQIANSIKSLYGTGMNVDGYLRRFIDLEYQLPKASVSDFCDFLFDEFGLREFFSNRRSDDPHEARYLLETFTKLADMFNFSLRQQEHCFAQFSIALHTTPDNHRIYPIFLAFLIALKTADRDMYNQFMSETLSPEQVIEFIKEQPGGKEFLKDPYGEGIEIRTITAFFDDDKFRQLIRKYESELEKEDIIDELYAKATRMKEVLQAYNRKRDFYVGKYLMKKIEILERFST
jgi:hypothetical protein